MSNRRPASRPRALRHALALAAALLAPSGCMRERATATPPAAEFLVTAGDSTFWVRTGPEGVRVRRAPIVLARVDGRFYELYVADDDRSFHDATFVGQRVYRRDLLTNDSLAIFDDPVVPRLARAYAAEHPHERPLSPDEEGSSDPRTVVTSEAEVLDVLGPYVTIEHHTDIDIDRGEDRHITRRGVVDLRRGVRASLASIFGDSAAARLAAEGRRAFLSALDSVRRGGSRDDDERARRAADAIDAFAFDSSSFALTAHQGEPVVAFLAPGLGERAGGLSLPLPPVPGPRLPWWLEARDGLPTHGDSIGDEWRDARYDVVVRADTAARQGDERLVLLVRDRDRREWSLGPLPGPAHLVWRLDGPDVDAASRRALGRAFDESVLYDEEARTARGGDGAFGGEHRARLARASRPEASPSITVAPGARWVLPRPAARSTRRAAPRREVASWHAKRADRVPADPIRTSHPNPSPRT